MLMDPTKAKVRATYKHSGTFYTLDRDAAGRFVYAGSDDYGIHVFDLSAAKKESVAHWIKHDNYVSSLVCLQRAGKNLVVSGSYGRHLIWWDADNGQAIRSAEAHAGWIRGVIATPDGSRLVSVGDDMLVKIWDSDTGRLVRELDGHEKRSPQGHVTALYVVAASQDGKFLASADRIGDVRVWETDSGKLLSKFQVPILYTYDPRQRKRSIGGIRSLAFSLDGASLAVGGIGQVNNVDGLAGPVHLEMWDWRQPRQRFTAGAEGHQGIINHLQFHPREPWLIGAGGGSGNGFLAFWKIEKDGKALAATHRIKADGHIHQFRLSPKGDELLAAGFRKLDVWSV
jgi:WD40 repeat protein